MPRRSSVIARVVGVACAASALAGVAAGFVAAPACATHECDGAPYLPLTATPDLAVDPNVWESSPIYGEWKPYGPRQDIYLNFGAPLSGDASDPSNRRHVEDVEVFISADKSPVTDGINFGLASGNVAEMTYDTNGQGLHVFNDTCAQYYVRIVVHFAPLDAGAPDAGADVDAGADAADADAD